MEWKSGVGKWGGEGEGEGEGEERRGRGSIVFLCGVVLDFCGDWDGAL